MMAKHPRSGQRQYPLGRDVELVCVCGFTMVQELRAGDSSAVSEGRAELATMIVAAAGSLLEL